MALFLTGHVFALEADVKILTKDEIVKLSNEDLLKTYIDVCVEIEAAKSLHATSGYMPKEYSNFKELLRYKITLLNEIKSRKLDVPATE